MLIFQIIRKFAGETKPKYKNKMKQSYKIRKGLDLCLEGEATHVLDIPPMRSEVALKPSDFCGVVPRVLVKEGDSVLAGTPLFPTRPQEQ